MQLPVSEAGRKAKVQRLVRAMRKRSTPRRVSFAGYRLPAYSYDKILMWSDRRNTSSPEDPIALKVHEQLTPERLSHICRKKQLSRGRAARPSAQR